VKIKTISVYRVEIPFKPLGSLWVGRRKPAYLDSTIVELETESGLTGVGESCPIGAVYLPAFTEGLRASIAEIAPALLGQDAGQISVINQTMNDALFGHGYAKTAIDIACWDLLGKQTGLSVSRLLGGRFQSEIPAYASIPLNDPQVMVETLQCKQNEGFTRFQIKVGDDPIDDVERVKAVVAAGRPDDVFMADANRGWSKPDALRAVAGFEGIDCYVEQPCDSYRACLSVRRQCRQPLILDEVINNMTELSRAIADDALDGLVIKVSHAGGLSQAMRWKDLCLSHGILMRIEDTAGTEVTRAAQAQLAAATPLDMQLGCYTFINEIAPIADGAPEIQSGKLVLNDEPGLGLTLRKQRLGDPIAVYRLGD